MLTLFKLEGRKVSLYQLVDKRDMIGCPPGQKVAKRNSSVSKNRRRVRLLSRRCEADET